VVAVLVVVGGSVSGAGTAERRVLIVSSPFDDGCDELVLGQASLELVISPSKVGSCSGFANTYCGDWLVDILLLAHLEGGDDVAAELAV
jgi:hypothetical protein